MVAGDTRKSPRYRIEVSDIAVRRYNSDGTLDSTFGTVVLPQVEPIPGAEEGERPSILWHECMGQANGKIIVSGWLASAVCCCD